MTQAKPPRIASQLTIHGADSMDIRLGSSGSTNWGSITFASKGEVLMEITVHTGEPVMWDILRDLERAWRTREPPLPEPGDDAPVCPCGWSRSACTHPLCGEDGGY